MVSGWIKAVVQAVIRRFSLHTLLLAPIIQSGMQLFAIEPRVIRYGGVKAGIQLLQ